MEGNNLNQQSNMVGGQPQNLSNTQTNVGTQNTNHINNISAVAANNRQNAGIQTGVGQNNFNQVNSVNFSNPNNNMNSGAPQSSYGYVEPPKKKNTVLTFIVIFLILAVAAIGGYFAGQYIYNVTH